MFKIGGSFMYNDNEVLYGVRDLDEDIRKREALLEKLQSLPQDAQWDEVADQLYDVNRSWKRIAYWDSAYEDKLIEAYEERLDHFYRKRKALLSSYQAAKEALIARTKELVEGERLHLASEEMQQLMEEWKQIPSAGKSADDALWEDFRNARQSFYDRRQEQWKDLQEKFAYALEVKQKLIAEAEAMMHAEDWNATSEKYRQLMQQWKEVGSAGKEHEDRLWEAFQTSRQTFYDRRAAYYERLREQQSENYEQKQSLIQQAKEVVEEQEFTREQTEKMKALGADWKKIGSCGKEKDDQVWEIFRGVMDAYFQGLTRWNQQRHMQWRQRMVDQKTRKQELIQNQKRQIRRMQEEIIGLIGEKAILDMEDRIAEKEEFIEKLEAEIAEIEQRLLQDDNKHQE